MTERRKLITTGLSPFFVALLEQFLKKHIPSAHLERRSGELWITASKSANRRAVEAFLAYRAGFLDGRENR